MEYMHNMRPFPKVAEIQDIISNALRKLTVHSKGTLLSVALRISD